jgi:carbon-monoxide dehydrogenase medium subunit
MKSAAFTHHSPQTLQEALVLLGQCQNAKVLAGGQSLMPMMNYRLVGIDHLIDINSLVELDFIKDEKSFIEFGSMVRQYSIAKSDLVSKRLPLMSEAIQYVGHMQTRNRGTLGGSLSHFDPSAEMPLVAYSYDAQLVVLNVRGSRVLSMAEFGQDFMTTALEGDELLVAIRMSPWPEGHGYSFVEFARRHGDFAIVSVATLMTLDANGFIDRVSIHLGGVAATPLRLTEVEAELLGQQPSEALFVKVSQPLSKLDALSDKLYPSWYRARLAQSLVVRSLTAAQARCLNIESVESHS